MRFSPPADLAPDVNAAPAAVLEAVPGLDPAVVQVMMAARGWGRRIESLDALLAALPPDLRDRVAAHYGDLVGRIAFEPVAWDASASGVDHDDAGRRRPAVIERWVRAGTRVAVVRRALP